MIVREEADSFELVRQHDHDRVAGQFAEHWSEPPRPPGPTLYAVSDHGLAWQEIDESVVWDEETGRPHDFADHPAGPKPLAYGGGPDLMGSGGPYAAYLCSRYYTIIVGRSRDEGGEAFEEPGRRRRRIEERLSAQELDDADRNLGLLRLCDGPSPFVCPNREGETDCPPPYPDGLGLDGTGYEVTWADRETLRLQPDPFSEPFAVTVPYLEVGKDRRGGRHRPADRRLKRRRGAPAPEHETLLGRG